jgi:WD40 repeat protein
VPAIFISHSSADAEAARRLAARLEQEGFSADDLFLDIHPEFGLRPGVEWEPELYRQLDRCDAVIFWASGEAVASRWCFAEIALARSHGRVVFDVGLAGQPPHDLLRDRQALRAPDETALHNALILALNKSGFDPRDSFKWDPGRPPFPGLDAFSDDDAAVFYGRDDLVRRLQDELDPRFPRSVAVIGPSGSGKSSLVRAGLIPRLQRQDPRWVVLTPFRPGTHGDPFAQLARALAYQDPTLGRPSALAREIRSNRATMRDIVIDLLPPDRSDGRLLLTMDQGEELFTGVDPDTAIEFLALLSDLQLPPSPCSLVTTIRSEFLSRLLLEDPPVTEMSPVQVLVAPLARSRLAEVIEGPAKRANLRLEPGVVDRLVAETPSGDALPLLAFALRELWDSANTRGTDSVTMEMVDGLGAAAGGGGVVGALTAQADRATGEVPNREVVVPTLMKLARVEPHAEPTRRRVIRSGLAEGEQTVVEAFLKRRLLKTETSEQGVLIEVTHEALLRQWPPLREAIEDQREVLLLASEVERAATDWKMAGKDQEYCLPPARLRAAMAALNGGAELSADPVVTEFLKASAAADEGLRIERADEVASRVRYTCDDDPETAAITAFRAAEEFALTPLLAQALNHALDRNRVVGHLVGHTGPVLSVRFSASGAIVTTSEDGEVRIWEPCGTLRATCRSERGTPSDACFAPDERTLVTAHSDGSVLTWELGTESPTIVAELGLPTGRVRTAVFDRTGQQILTAGEDGLARIWSGGRVIREFAGARGLLLAASFSPDGSSIVTAGSDAVVRVYDAASGVLLREFEGHEDWVRSPAFSPDGRLVISASEDATARLWSTATGEVVGVIDGHRSRVRGAAFLDADHVITASGDRTCRVWTLTGAEKLVLRGHRDRLRACAIAPAQQIAATASEDNTCRLWSLVDPNGRALLDHGSRLRAVAYSEVDPSEWAAAAEDGSVILGKTASGGTRVVDRHEGRASDIAWSQGEFVSVGHDGLVRAGRDEEIRTLASFPSRRLRAIATHGSSIAVAGSDGFVAVYDSGEWTNLAEDGGDVLALAFSPDGRSLALGGTDKVVQIWSLERQELILEHRGHSDWVRALAYSPDGRSLLSGAEDATVRLWTDPASPSEGRIVARHDDWVRDVAWTRGGDRFVTCSGDGTISAWSREGEMLHVMAGHGDLVGCIAVLPDEETILSASHDGTVRVWRSVALPDLIREARVRIAADLEIADKDG